jgi:hypothetical protein
MFGSPDGTGTGWRLSGVADIAAASKHHVQLRFDVTGGQLQGWLVLHGSGDEIALDEVRFDGTSLSLRLPASLLARLPVTTGGDGRPAKPPRLSLTLMEDREFRGYYVDESGTRLDPDHQLRLVKVDDE